MNADNINPVYDQVAHLVVAGLSLSEVANALDVTVEDVTALTATEGYKKHEVIVKTKNITTARTINDGWDDLEKTTIHNLKEIVKYNKDPDFTLRVAAVANRAKRSPVGGNNAIEGNSSMRATISLPAIFINKLQQNGGQLNIGSQATPQHLVQSKVDMLRPADVEKVLFGGDKDQAGELLGPDFKPEL